jgi:N-acetylglucosaminyl-diphospho-decaprenol L-rhamnosyltransferase
MSAQVAVAVVSWNTRQLLRECLRSLAPEAESGRAEVWVVDNGSTDGSPAMVESEFPWVALEVPGENLGFGRAVNLVAQRTSAPWIAPANADIQLTSDALEVLLATGERHPRAGIVAPRLLRPDGSTQHSVYHFPTLSFFIAFNLGLPALSPRLADRLCMEGAWDAERAREVDWAIGAFLLVRRAAFDEVSGFDPEQWLYAEDIDLAWRLARRGWRTRYEPRASVRHEVSASVSQALGDDLARRDRWMAATYAWMARRRGVASAWSVGAVNYVGMGVRFAGLSALAAISPERWAGPRDYARDWLPPHRNALRSRRRLLARG